MIGRRKAKRDEVKALFPAAQVLEYLVKRLGYDGFAVRDASVVWAKRNRKKARREVTQIDMLNQIEAILKKEKA